MTIFSRYVFRQASGALLLILLSLTGIVWISLALRELNVVTSSGQSAFTLVKMTTLGLPNFIAIIAPFAFLIAIIHTLNRLNGDSEIIVLTASGATAWTIVRPVAALAVLVCLLVAFVNNFAMPWSLRQLREIIVAVRSDVLTQVIQPGRFSSPEQGLTFHIRERALNGELQGLLVNDARQPNQSQAYLAERGLIVKQDGSDYLIMTNGHILRTASRKEPTQIIAFEKYVVDLDRFEQKTTQVTDLKARERYFSELVDPNAPAKDVGRFRSEIHERLASPFYPLAFGLLAVALVGQAQSTRQNRSARMAVCFAAGVGLRLAGLATNNVVTLDANATPLLYLIPIGSVAGSLVLIVRGAKLGAGGAIERFADQLTSSVQRLRGLVGSRIPATTAGR